jgi:hypothetical protein
VTFKVLVDDKFHYMDESKGYEHGVFSTWDEAVAACKRIVDEDLARPYKPGLSSEESFETYVRFGEYPFIVGEPSGQRFSARDYARAPSAIVAGAAPAN